MLRLKRPLAFIAAALAILAIGGILPALASGPAPRPAAQTQLYSITEYPVPTARSTPYAIIGGPDQGIWFTERTGNKIGRLNPADGSVVEYPIPTANSGPSGIVIGAGGNMRFSEYNASKIGRITPAGTISEYRLPRANSGPLGIASRLSDGSIWFTEYNVGKVARLSPGSSNITVTEPISLSV